MGSDLRIDYGELTGLVDEGVRQTKQKKKRRARLRSAPARIARAALILLALAVLPFALLIRGGVFAYQVWGLGTWPALILSATASAGVLGLYAWVVSRRLGAGKLARTRFTRAAAAVGIAYVGYALVFVASENVKSEEVAQEFSTVHPLLRVATSALTLVDPGAVITDAGRTAEDYRLMGLPTNEASLHFEQSSGYVHALDLRTNGRPEWRNRAVELGFWALGFHSLRHVGTADHLHISLRLPS
ncbi:MAG: hypothetical protein AAF389_04985 [Gemmatimonadota bacterium]